MKNRLVDPCLAVGNESERAVEDFGAWRETASALEPTSRGSLGPGTLIMDNDGG
jgi:hypothetical protein